VALEAQVALAHQKLADAEIETERLKQELEIEKVSNS
jgi:hypothetical protein